MIDQPPPIKNENPALWDLVIDDMRSRDRVGQERYGVRLQTHNGRDFLVDLMQEQLDGIVYLKGLQEELKELGRELCYVARNSAGDYAEGLIDSLIEKYPFLGDLEKLKIDFYDYPVDLPKIPY